MAAPAGSEMRYTITGGNKAIFLLAHALKAPTPRHRGQRPERTGRDKQARDQIPPRVEQCLLCLTLLGDLPQVIISIASIAGTYLRLHAVAIYLQQEISRQRYICFFVCGFRLHASSSGCPPPLELQTAIRN